MPGREGIRPRPVLPRQKRTAGSVEERLYSARNPGPGRVRVRSHTTRVAFAWEEVPLTIHEAGSSRSPWDPTIGTAKESAEGLWPPILMMRASHSDHPSATTWGSGSALGGAAFARGGLSQREKIEREREQIKRGNNAERSSDCAAGARFWSLPSLRWSALAQEEASPRRPANANSASTIPHLRPQRAFRHRVRIMAEEKMNAPGPLGASVASSSNRPPPWVGNA